MLKSSKKTVGRGLAAARRRSRPEWTSFAIAHPMLTRGVLTLATVALAGGIAAAQEPPLPLGGEAPTAGVRLPSPSLVGRGDASALELNPGALGTLASWSVLFQHTEMVSDGRIAGTGTALFVALPLPLLRSLVFGLDLQWLRPTDPIGYDNYVKLGAGIGWQPTSSLSLGFAVHGLIADGDEELDGLASFDAGLVLRPAEWVSAGIVVRDINTPVYAGLPVQRSYDLELAFRPLRHDRLELGAGLRIGERRGDLNPHFRLATEPIAGLRLFSDVELVRRDFYRIDNRTTDVRVTVGMALHLERIGLAVSTILGRKLRRASGGGPLASDDTRGVFQGMSVSLALSGQRRRPLFETRGKLIKVALRGRHDQLKIIRLVRQLQLIRDRNDVSVVLLDIDRFGAGWAQTEELRQWVGRLRGAGKRVYAYLHVASSREYLLASAADKVWLAPAGGIRLAGLATQQLYLRGLMDKIGLGPEFVKIAEYKSAPEGLTRKGASPAAARMRKSLLDNLYGRLLGQLARSRGSTPAKMRETIEDGPFTPPAAKKAKLVDEIVPKDEVLRRVARVTRTRPGSLAALQRSNGRWPVGPLLAVVVIEGDIIRGKSRRGLPLIGGGNSVGDETIVAALDAVRTSSRVKGVVIRVNSPGGSATASHRMWKAIRRLRKVKPVIVSFADIAASGGYYAAAGADRILAQPMTITGSIGIFTGKIEASGLLDKLGVKVESLEYGKRPLMESFARPYSTEERKFILDRLQYYYRAFLDAVATGRRMKANAVDKVARGRVWTGSQARSRRLVDGFGGLHEAMLEVKRRAGLPLDRRLPLLVLPRPKKTLLKRMLKLIGAKDARAPLPAPLRRLLGAIPPSLLEARHGDPLARLPYRLVIE